MKQDGGRRPGERSSMDNANERIEKEAASIESADEDIEKEVTSIEKADEGIENVTTGSNESDGNEPEKSGEGPEENGKGTKGCKKLEIPPINDLRMELAREEARHEFRRSLLNIAGVLTVAAAVTALMMTRLLILLQVNGSSMAPTLEEDEIVILRQTKEIETGDIVGFYYGGKILLKRAIGSAGDEIDIDQEGNVYVNGKVIDEPYVEDKNLGKCDQDFPYQVPEGMIFVLGDNRAVSIDSRMKAIGCVEESQIVGKAAFRAWPKARIGMIH